MKIEEVLNSLASKVLAQRSSHGKLRMMEEEEEEEVVEGEEVV